VEHLRCWINSFLPSHLVVRNHWFKRHSGGIWWFWFSDSESPQNWNPKTCRPTYCGVTLSQTLIPRIIISKHLYKSDRARYEDTPAQILNSASSIAQMIYSSCPFGVTRPLFHVKSKIDFAVAWVGLQSSYEILGPRFWISSKKKTILDTGQPLHFLKRSPQSHFSHHHLIGHNWVL